MHGADILVTLTFRISGDHEASKSLRPKGLYTINFLCYRNASPIEIFKINSLPFNLKSIFWIVCFSINRNSKFHNPDFNPLIVLELQAGETWQASENEMLFLPQINLPVNYPFSYSKLRLSQDLEG